MLVWWVTALEKHTNLLPEAMYHQDLPQNHSKMPQIFMCECCYQGQAELPELKGRGCRIMHWRLCCDDVINKGLLRRDSKST